MKLAKVQKTRDILISRSEEEKRKLVFKLQKEGYEVLGETT